MNKMWGTSCFQKRKKRTFTKFPIVTESKKEKETHCDLFKL